jgi:hypothetical protein
MTTELYGLTLQQHQRVEKIARDSKTIKRPGVDITKGAGDYPPPIRVVAMSNRVYDSTLSEALPVFEYDRDRTVYTIEQVGSALSGYLALTVNGERFIIECRADSLADVVAAVPGLRATVLPGLWELDFGELDEVAAAAISVTVEEITSAEDASLCELLDDEDSVAFTGSTIVRREFWVTSPDDDEDLGLVQRDVTDAIPFSTSSVAKGAIGYAIWNWDAGYTVIAWQCRTFSHAPLPGPYG